MFIQINDKHSVTIINHVRTIVVNASLFSDVPGGMIGSPFASVG